MLIVGEENKRTSWFAKPKQSKLESLASQQHQHQQAIADLEEQMESLEATKGKVYLDLFFLKKNPKGTKRIPVIVLVSAFYLFFVVSCVFVIV